MRLIRFIVLACLAFSAPAAAQTYLPTSTSLSTGGWAQLPCAGGTATYYLEYAP
jgi:hypothetical protein